MNWAFYELHEITITLIFNEFIGRCVCKHGIKGMKCDVCPSGSVLRSDGCTDLSIALPVMGSCRDHQCFYGAICKQKDNFSQCVCDFECDNDERQPIAQTVWLDIIIIIITLSCSSYF